MLTVGSINNNNLYNDHLVLPVHFMSAFKNVKNTINVAPATSVILTASPKKNASAKNEFTTIK